MTARQSIVSLVALAALAIGAPLHAQGVHVELSGGSVTPIGPTNGNVNAGGQLGLGLSHQLTGTRLSLGVEGSFVIFGERHLTYAVFLPVCNGCAPAVESGGSITHLDLANYFVTGKYVLGTGHVRPYVALAGGITQEWLPQSYSGPVHGSELNGGGRATAGIESQLGRVGVALDVSYATVSTLKYEGNLVRYVPVTLRLSF